MSELKEDKINNKLKCFALGVLIFACVIFCAGCETIDAINPVVQTGKMQQHARQVTQDAAQIKEYAVEMQKKELEQIEN